MQGAKPTPPLSLAGEVVVGVQTGRLRPEWPPGSPAGLVDVSSRCWAQDPGARPTFLDIIQELNKVESDLRMELLVIKEAGSSTSASTSVTSAVTVVGPAVATAAGAGAEL